MNSRYVKVLVSFAAVGIFFQAFQNCSYIGNFSSMDYYRLAAEDPHQDAWRPVHGLTVKDGEWVGIEEKVTVAARNTERNYVATVLYRAFLPQNEATWTAEPHATIKKLVDDAVQRNFLDFGGPCFYTIQEFGCNGRNLNHPVLQVSPASSVFRASLKQQVCDQLLQNDNALKNFEDNIKQINTMLGSSDIVYGAYQLFYLGQSPRKRTVAAMDDLYRRSQQAGTSRDEGLRYVGLAICASTGWEAP